MKKVRLSLALAALCLLLAACGAKSEGAPADGAEVHSLTAEEAKARMDSGDPVVILDVRTQEEYDEAHIENAVLLPNEDIGTEPPALLPDLNAELLIYCRSGNRSRQAAEKLLAMGYTQVYDFGGIKDWPYDTVSSVPGAAEPSAPVQAPAQDGAAKTGVLSTFTSIDLDGNAVDATVFSGKQLTMVNIWATFCGPCLREMPELGELNQEYADQGFQIIGIPVDTLDRKGDLSEDMIALAQDIVSKTGADYLHILPSDSLNKAKLNQVTAVPETIFVNEDGEQVGESYLGARSKKDWANIIETLLEETA